MSVSLPMYLAPRDALEAFWAAVREATRAHTDAPLPERLTWPADLHSHWLSPGLVLSQSCGYPLTHRLAGRVRLLGSFCYGVPGAQGVGCSSQLVKRRGDPRQTLADFRGGTVAFNAPDSQSGHNALRALVAPLAVGGRFFSAAVETGAHLASLDTVRRGEADLAAIDAVTWALALAAQPALREALVVFAQTDPYPGLPLISSLHTPDALAGALQAALHSVCTSPALAGLREPLRIQGFEATTLGAYQVCPAMEAEAAALGVHRL